MKIKWEEIYSTAGEPGEEGYQNVTNTITFVPDTNDLWKDDK